MQNNSVPISAEDNSATDSSATVSAPNPSTDTNYSQKSSSTGQAVARATAGIGVLHLARFVIGFLAQPLIAHNLGLRWQADAYAVSTDIVQRFWLIFEKVINPAFLPNFIAALKEEGEERAWRFASTTFWIVALLLLLITPLVWLGMPFLVAVLSHNAPAEEINLTVRIARFLLIGLFFLGMSSLTYTILNGYKRFVYAALGDAFWKLGIFAGAVLSYKLYGRELGELAKASKTHPLSPVEVNRLLELAEKSLWLITIGFTLGAICKILPHIVAIGNKWRLLRFRLDLQDPLAKKMFALAVPLLLGIVVSETRGFYLIRLANDPSVQVEAGRAALKWSRIIGDNLIQIFPYALSIGIFPYLADLARERDRQPLTDALLGALRVCIFVFVPFTAILIALRFPLLRAVWEGGRLTQSDTIAMSAPFVAFSLGLVGFACEMMLNQAFYAMTRAWAPTLIGLATSVLWVLVAKVGVESLGWGLAAIAGAESLSKTVKCIVMWQMLKPHLGNVRTRQNVVFCVKVLLCGLCAAVIAGVLASFVTFSPETRHFKFIMMMAVSFIGLAGMAVFAATAAMLRVEEARALSGLGGKLKRQLNRKGA